MVRARIEQLRRAIGQLSRVELEELVLISAMNHARTCDVASYHPPESHQPGEREADNHRHASEAEMRERIRSMDTDELVDLLSGVAGVVEAGRT
jgi:hypothetical protein